MDSPLLVTGVSTLEPDVTSESEGSVSSRCHKNKEGPKRPDTSELSREITLQGEHGPEDLEESSMYATMNSDEDEEVDELENVYINVLSDGYRYDNNAKSARGVDEPKQTNYWGVETEDMNDSDSKSIRERTFLTSRGSTDTCTPYSEKLTGRGNESEINTEFATCTLPSELLFTSESKLTAEEINNEEEDNNLNLEDQQQDGICKDLRAVGVSWMENVVEFPSRRNDHPVTGTIGEETGTLRAESRSTAITSRNASRLALESREAMFRRAMTLLSARCTSVHQGLESSLTATSKDQPFGQYIYINQEKPIPMPPLKAWRGYNGNVYFEPINIFSMKNMNTTEDGPEISRRGPTVESRHSKPISKKRTSDMPPPSDSRSNSRQTNKSSQGSVRPATRQMVLMDKQAVLSRFNENIQEDVVWLEGQENTGSLAIKPKRDRERQQTTMFNKEKICKGSVAHKLYVENKSKRQPVLAVSGGKFIPPNAMSPLLRAQTQYSLSSHRLTTNSPDPFHLSQDSKLPPLDQIRASLKHDQNVSRPKSYNRPVTLTHELKPFVKYSPDVVAKYSQQTNIC